MRKIIIGISSYFHESAVCIIINDKIIDYLKEEEITRVKGDFKFPKNSLKIILKKHKILENEIESIVFYEKPFLSWSSITFFSLLKPVKRWKIVLNQFQKFWTGSLSFSADIKKLINISSDKIYYSSHHVSHALSGLVFSKDNEKDYLIFVLDGVGDGETVSIYKKIKSDILTEYKCLFPDSLGLYYSAFTDYLGFNVNEGESKVMGLAAFGEPIYKDLILNEIIHYNEGELTLNQSWFAYSFDLEKSYSNKFNTKFGSPGTPDNYKNINGKDFKRMADIACSTQVALEETLISIVRYYILKTGIKNIVFAGGLGLNSKAMQKLAEIQEVNEFTVPPSPGDSGAATGAAIYGYMLSNGFKFPQISILPGKNYGESVKANIFENIFKKIEQSSQSNTAVANLIASGEIICTFFKDRELGPRALGSRSILCAGNKNEIIKDLNEKLKKRESFRPLAPMMRESKAEKYFYIDENIKHNLYWMGITVNAKEETIKDYPMTVHYDKTSRLQLIKSDNIFYENLFIKLEKMNINILINTSFNVAGDPMVFDYVDCYTNMIRMGLKYLVTDTGLFEIEINK